MLPSQGKGYNYLLSFMKLVNLHHACYKPRAFDNQEITLHWCFFSRLFSSIKWKPVSNIDQLPMCVYTTVVNPFHTVFEQNLAIILSWYVLLNCGWRKTCSHPVFQAVRTSHLNKQSLIRQPGKIGCHRAEAYRLFKFLFISRSNLF